MAFVSDRKLEGTSIGSRIKLSHDVNVLKGRFLAGSILEVIGDPDSRGEFECRDIDSGERVFLHPALSRYERL